MRKVKLVSAFGVQPGAATSSGVFWGAFIERDPNGHRANMADLVRWTADRGASGDGEGDFEAVGRNKRSALRHVANRNHSLMAQCVSLRSTYCALRSIQP